MYRLRKKRHTAMGADAPAAGDLGAGAAGAAGAPAADLGADLGADAMGALGAGAAGAPVVGTAADLGEPPGDLGEPPWFVFGCFASGVGVGDGDGVRFMCAARGGGQGWG